MQRSIERSVCFRLRVLCRVVQLPTHTVSTMFSLNCKNPSCPTSGLCAKQGKIDLVRSLWSLSTTHRVPFSLWILVVIQCDFFCVGNESRLPFILSPCLSNLKRGFYEYFYTMTWKYRHNSIIWHGVFMIPRDLTDLVTLPEIG